MDKFLSEARIKKPEGPTIDCQKQEADELHQWIFFWLLAS
jgi:hypothetical protein